MRDHICTSENSDQEKMRHGNFTFNKKGIKCTYKKMVFFVGLPHLATYIFIILSMNEPELGAEIDPGLAFNPFPSSILDKTRRDLNPQPLDHESSPLTTRPDLCP